MANENITASGNAAIDNVIPNGDNSANQVDDNAAANATGAGSSGPEDTPNEWQNIIEAKDGIISAYEKQVESLKAQVANLVRNGATISEQNQTTQDNANAAQTGNMNPLGGFGAGFGTGESFGDFKDLGKEIGKRD